MHTLFKYNIILSQTNDEKKIQKKNYEPKQQGQTKPYDGLF